MRQCSKRGTAARPPAPALLALVVLLAVLLLVGTGCGAKSAEVPANEETEETGAAGGETTGTGGETTGASGGGETTVEPAAPADDRPNIVFIVTDDMDEGMLEEMPIVRARMVEMGVEFENAFVTNSLCCPSRATMLRGQYSHNHHITSNDVPDGGGRRFRELGLDESTFATWLNGSGYRTALVGKYMNNVGREYIPPGWDEWRGMVGEARERTLNENGVLRGYAEERHMTDVYRNEALDFVRAATDDGESEPPFALWVGTSAPHLPANYATRHADMYQNAQMPRPPSFNEANVADKAEWMRNLSSFSEKRVQALEVEHRERLRSIQSVDEMVGAILGVLKDRKELRDTYVVFTTDNGLQRGEHRLQKKVVPYEESMGVPLVIRGPGVPRGATRDHLVANNDLAPTFAGWAGAPVPDFVDGRSLAPLLKEDLPDRTSWRTALLNERDQQEPAVIPDYKAVRTATHTYVEWETGEKELYDLGEDPHQVRSIHETADPELLEDLRARLETLRDCAEEECRAAEDAQGPQAPETP